MSDWCTCPLGNVAEVQTGPFGSQLHQSDYKALGTPIITVEHLGDNRIIHSNLPLVGDDDKQRLKKYMLRTGDIVFSRVGSVDRCAFVHREEDGWMFSGRLLRVRAREKVVDSRFLSFYFSQESFKDTIRMIAVGATMPSINTEILSTVEVTLPPLPEQRAIASVLSSLDDKIDLLHRQNKTLEEIAEAIFKRQFMFDSEKRPITKLSEHITVNRGLSYKGSGLCAENEGVPMHNLNSVYEGGGYKYSGIKYYNGPYKERHLIEPGDVVVANTEQGHKYLLIGYPAMVPKLFGQKGIFSQHLYRVDVRDGSPFSKIFLYYLLKSAKVWEQVIGAANGSTVNMLAAAGLETAEFNIPPRNLIDEFTDFGRYTLEKQENNIRLIQTLSRLRDTLLPKLMSGEVRVKL